MILEELPLLFILTNNKKRFWKIWIEKNNDNIYIYREYGIINGKITKIKKEYESLKKATTQINFLWRKKKESGFQEENEIKNNLIKMKSNIIKPMGAHKLDDYYSKIKYPAYIQKKLDGFRCLSNIIDKKVILYSKNMKIFLHLNHIKLEILKIKELLNDINFYLDGELYEFGIPLNNIYKLVMKKYVSEKNIKDMEKISYYIFDIFNVNNLNLIFEERYNILKKIFENNKFKYLKLVECKIVNSYEEIKDINIEYLYEGYEGVIVRNKHGVYKLNSKSYDVLRTKEFKKNNFLIIGAKEGNGIQKGSIIFKLKCLNNNNSFYAIPIGTIDNRKKMYLDYIKNPLNYINKYAIVKYLEINEDGCVSRNPIIEKIIF